MVRRSRGFVWEFRYQVIEGTRRKLKQITLDGNEYQTERAARQHLAPLVHKLNDGCGYLTVQQFTFGQLLTRYEQEELPTKKSTRGSPPQPFSVY